MPPDAEDNNERADKNTNWEGAFRVPCLIRWPGRIQPGSVSNELIGGLDWLPALVAAAGDPDTRRSCSGTIPRARKAQHAAVRGANEIGLLAVGLFDPFAIAARRDDAAMALVRGRKIVTPARHPSPHHRNGTGQGQADLHRGLALHPTLPFDPPEPASPSREYSSMAKLGAALVN